MFEVIKQSLTGFALVVSSFFVPSGEMPVLKLKSIDKNISGYEIEYKLNMAWNRKLEELVDAGIPFRLRVTLESDKNDNIQFFRTLHYNVLDYSYAYIDSAGKQVQWSPQKYNLIHLALKDFGRFKFVVNNRASNCILKIELLPGWVSHLKRNVDMSQIWGKKSLTIQTDLIKASKK